MRFIIKSFDYNAGSGGVMVLHKMADVLSNMGQEVYLLCYITYPESTAKCISESESEILLSNDEDIIVIYPEVIKGNPLKAKNVVRWCLYKPGINGGEKIYSDEEHIFTYKKEFIKDTIYKDRPVLFTFISKTDKFYDQGLQRSGTCFLYRKGSKIHKTHVDGYYIDMDTIKYKNRIDSYLLETFNKYEKFISYDAFTYYSIIASMCGCISLVIPDPSLPKENFYSGFTKYGIGYGLDEEAWALQTRDLVKPHIESMYVQSIESINEFINYCEKHFISY